MMYLFEQKSNNPIAPSWYYWISQNNIFTKSICEEAKSILLFEEQNILEQTVNKVKSDGGTGLGLDSITSRYMHYNVLNWKYNFIKILRNEIHKSLDEYLKPYQKNFKCNEYYIKSWFNVLRKEELITRHHHADHSHTFLGGHLTICTKDTHTYYENPYNNEIFKIKNNPGDLVLFPNWIKHWTDRYLGDDVRISIAMDITYKDAIDSIPYYPGKEFVNYYILK
jgi:hypothetical protein